MAKHVLPKALAFLAISAVSATPASAQSMTAAAGSLTWAKTDAILGGAPSALEAILSQQSGAQAPAPRAQLQPASYSRPQLPLVQAAVRLGPSPGVWNGRPDVFGSVALRIAHTRLDSRWKQVEHSSVDGAAARFAEAQRGKSPVEKLEAVDWYVNKRVRFVDDQVQWGRPDVWSAANVTLSRGRGDCEDYAIAKLALLRRAGFADRDLYLVILKDLVRRADHAVLVARAAGHMYVLDNGTDQLLDSETVPDYRPILTFASSGTWTHGYRVPSAPINIAANETPEEPTRVAAADQRSWSASLLAFNTGFSR